MNGLRQRMRRRRPAGSVVASVLLLALALGGCQPAQLGAAAIVDGQRIPVDQVQAAVNDVRTLQARVGQPAQQPGDLARQELQRRLIMAVYERTARELGVRVSAGEVSAELARAQQAAGSEEEFTRQLASQNLSLDSARHYVRQSLLARKIGESLVPNASGQQGQADRDQAVTARLVRTAKQMRFEVNPRYGDFDTSNGQLAEHRENFIRPMTAAPPTSPGTGR